MPLVYCGACSHAPGITARAERADTLQRQALEKALYRMGDDIRATQPDALVVVAAEHFANFFMNNMPAFAIGMADSYEGPIEDEAFLRSLTASGFEPELASTPDKTRRFVADEVARWGPVIKAIGLKLD